MNTQDHLDYLDGIFDARHDFPSAGNVLATMQVGSQAYNLHGPNSDIDYFSVVLPTTRHLLGLGNFESWEPTPEQVGHGLDYKVYSVEKFVRLALQGNPNVIECLFFQPHLYHRTSPEWALLMEHRDAFLSKKVYKRFAGYAAGQMKKMESGKYTQDSGHKRKALIDQIGYDPKDASRLVHLLFMGIEIAAGGTVTPWVENPSERGIILGIKRGEWPLGQIKEFAEGVAERNEARFQTRCPLPDEPDTDFVESLLIEIQRRTS